MKGTLFYMYKAMAYILSPQEWMTSSPVGHNLATAHRQTLPKPYKHMQALGDKRNSAGSTVATE